MNYFKCTLEKKSKKLKTTQKKNILHRIQKVGGATQTAPVGKANSHWLFGIDHRRKWYFANSRFGGLINSAVLFCVTAELGGKKNTAE